MSKKLNKEKFETIEKLLNDEYLLVHLDSTKEGVDLPGHIMDSPQVTLKLSRLFRGGLEVTQDSLVSNLLFGSQYYLCKVPMIAIWGATSWQGHNIIWPDTAPKHILFQLTQATTDSPQTGTNATVKTPKPKKKTKKSISKKKPTQLKASHLKRIK